MMFTVVPWRRNLLQARPFTTALHRPCSSLATTTQYQHNGVNRGSCRRTLTSARFTTRSRNPVLIVNNHNTKFSLSPVLQVYRTSCRSLTTSLSQGDIQKRLDEFQDLFVEARLCIEDATDSAGTRYFEDDAQAAIDAVNEAVQAFQRLIDDIENEDEKNRVLRSNGLKVEQLKGELEMAIKGGHDH